jgi:hypothetical protein
LKTTGLKKELIERLQSVSPDGVDSTNFQRFEGDASLSRDESSVVRRGVSGEFSKMSVKELRDILAERGLPTNGLKAQLVERLENADESNPLDAKSATLSSAKLSERAATFREEWNTQIERQLAVATQDTALLLSLLRTYLNLSGITTLSRLRPAQSAWTITGSQRTIESPRAFRVVDISDVLSPVKHTD